MASLKRTLRRIRYGEPVSPGGVRESQFAFPKTWEERTTLAVASEDNARIPRVSGAGQVRGDTQVMHNGLLVPTGGYYGEENARLIETNRGVHEPQEELVFGEVLPHIAPGSFMIELGCYWAFYGSWFLKDVPESRALLVEPDPKCIEVGRRTLELNGLTGRAAFEQGHVGRFLGGPPPGAREVTVDGLVQSHKIERIQVLHADVQGEEVRMLKGAAKALGRGMIDWVFISTHSMYRHAACRRMLLKRGFILIAEADLPESYSYDGLLVFKRRGVPGPDRIAVSQRRYPSV